MNNKQRYKALVKQKFAYKLKHSIRILCVREPMPIPKQLQEMIKEAWLEKQKEILQVQVRTFNHSFLIPSTDSNILK